MINELDEIKALFDEFYLIDEPLKNEVKENENPLKINFEGGNKTGLVFVFEAALSVQDTEMIGNLLSKAMKLTMEDVAFITMSGQPPFTMVQMINIIKPKHLIIWGAKEWLMENNINIKQYEVMSTGEYAVLTVDRVSLFHDNVPLKTTLWTGIQQLLKM